MEVNVEITKQNFPIPASGLEKIKALELGNNKEKENLSRFKIPLPELDGAIDPDHPNLKTILDNMAIFEATRGGFSKATQKNMFSAVRSWIRFTEYIELAYAFPIHPRMFYYWILHLKNEQKVSYATLMSRKNLIAIFLNQLGFANVTEDKLIKDFFRGVKKDMAESDLSKVEQKVASPFRASDLNRQIEIVGTLEQAGPKLFKDLAYMTIAYSTALREEEIFTLKRKNVIISGDTVTIVRTKSKTSAAPPKKSIIGRYAGIVKKYIELVEKGVELYNHVTPSSPVEDQEYYIFGWILKNGQIKDPLKPMNGVSVLRLFRKAYERQSVFKGRCWSGHSARCGAVVDGHVVHKMNAVDLMSIGDWTNMGTVKRYLRATGHLEASNIELQKH